MKPDPHKNCRLMERAFKSDGYLFAFRDRLKRFLLAVVLKCKCVHTRDKEGGEQCYQFRDFDRIESTNKVANDSE